MHECALEDAPIHHAPPGSPLHSTGQLIPQAPGPRGSPQRPQGAGAASDREAPPTATRENRTGSVSEVPHFGHVASAFGRDDSSSNVVEQFLQAYS